VYAVGNPAEHRFEMQTTIADVSGAKESLKAKLLTALSSKFADVLNVTPTVDAKDVKPDPDAAVNVDAVNNLIDKAGIVQPITKDTLDQVFENTPNKGIPVRDVTAEKGGVAILLDDIHVPNSKASITAKDLESRISRVRQSQDPTIVKIPYRHSRVIPITVVDKAGQEVAAHEGDDRPLVRAVVVTRDESEPYEEGSETKWRSDVAASEWMILQRALAAPNDQFEGVTSFDAVVAGQAKAAAAIAIVLSLALIVIYVWIRFGGIRYGLGAIFSLMHDAIVALAATVLATYIAGDPAHPHWLGSHLLISDFKINLTMIAAYLTVIGYSVNDTIVIFDRVRELRGKSQAPLTPKLINDAINQCFGRTVWTTFTVFIVVLIMYVWGGEGVRGFSYAMLIGVITGAYSTLAIASPMLLATGTKEEKGPPAAPKALQRRNPFLQPEPTEKP
jgi:SecD/SecF fusion protein